MPVFIEGYLDEAIVNHTIDLIAKKSDYIIKRNNFFVDRAKGINSVFKRLNDANYSCIGVIDNDKVKSDIFDNFVFCRSLGNLKIYYLGENNIHRFLLVFDPASEKWVMDTAVSIGLEKTYSFISDIDEFMNYSKKRSINNEVENIIKKIFFENTYNAVIFRRIFYGIFKRYLK